MQKRSEEYDTLLGRLDNVLRYTVVQELLCSFV